MQFSYQLLWPLRPKKLLSGNKVMDDLKKYLYILISLSALSLLCGTCISLGICFSSLSRVLIETSRFLNFCSLHLSLSLTLLGDQTTSCRQRWNDWQWRWVEIELDYLQNKKTYWVTPWEDKKPNFKSYIFKRHKFKAL